VLISVIIITEDSTGAKWTMSEILWVLEFDSNSTVNSDHILNFNL